MPLWHNRDKKGQLRID